MIRARFFNARIAKSRIKSKRPRQFDSLSNACSTILKTRRTVLSFSPFKLVLVAGSEIEIKKFSNPGLAQLGFENTRARCWKSRDGSQERTSVVETIPHYPWWIPLDMSRKTFKYFDFSSSSRLRTSPWSPRKVRDGMFIFVSLVLYTSRDCLIPSFTNAN